MRSGQDYVGAIEMLQAMEDRGRLKQVGNTQAGAKLFKLIEWEILLVQIMQFLSQWPKSSTTGKYAIETIIFTLIFRLLLQAVLLN